MTRCTNPGIWMRIMIKKCKEKDPQPLIVFKYFVRFTNQILWYWAIWYFSFENYLEESTLSISDKHAKQNNSAQKNVPAQCPRHASNCAFKFKPTVSEMSNPGLWVISASHATLPLSEDWGDFFFGLEVNFVFLSVFKYFLSEYLRNFSVQMDW